MISLPFGFPCGLLAQPSVRCSALCKCVCCCHRRLLPSIQSCHVTLLLAPFIFIKTKLVNIFCERQIQEKRDFSLRFEAGTPCVCFFFFLPMRIVHDFPIFQNVIARICYFFFSLRICIWSDFFRCALDARNHFLIVFFVCLLLKFVYWIDWRCL